MDELTRPTRRPTGSRSHWGGVEDPRRRPPRLGPAPVGHARPPGAHPPPRPREPPGSHPAPRARPHPGARAPTHAWTPGTRSEHAVIQGFDATSYTATIQLLRSPDITLARVPVSRGIPASAIAPGQQAAVLFFDRHDPTDAMVVGVH